MNDNHDLKITIVSVVYNGVKTIENMIMSVVNQSYKNIEFIIIDGGSVDGTVDILKKYDTKITFWCSEKDNGIYDAMNKALDHVSGDYVQFIGADDFFASENVISDIAAEIDHNVSLYSTCVTCVNEETGFEITPGHFRTTFGKLEFLWIQHGGLFTKSDLIKKIKFDDKYKVSADYKFILQCLKEEYSVQYSNIVSIYFSQSGISSKSYNDICMLENMQISNELNLGLVYSPIPYWKKMIKDSFFFSVMDKMRKIIFQKGKKHRCRNDWCRWCRGK